MSFVFRGRVFGLPLLCLPPWVCFGIPSLGSLLVRFGAPFWCRWSVLGLRFGASGASWGFRLVDFHGTILQTPQIQCPKAWRGLHTNVPHWVGVLHFFLARCCLVNPGVAPFSQRNVCKRLVQSLRPIENAVVAIKTKDQTKLGSEREHWRARHWARPYIIWTSDGQTQDITICPRYRNFLYADFRSWCGGGGPFWCRWSVLGLCFRAGRPFWDSILVTPFLGLHFGGGPFLGLRFGAGGRFWGSILVPVVRFGAPFWCQWSVLGLHFGAGGPFLGLDCGTGGPFWGSVLVRWSVFGARFWCRWSVLGLHFGAAGPFWGSILGWSVLGLGFGSGGPFLGLHFGAGGPFLGLGFGAAGRFWGSILVPVVRFGAPFWCRWSVLGLVVRFGAPLWCRWSVFGARFWYRWSVLGLHFGSGGPFWGFGLVVLVRFWGSILVRVVRFGARFCCRWSVLGLHCGAGGPFLGLDCGTGGPFWGSVLVPVVRFEAPFWLVFRYSGSVRFGDPFWGSILVPVVRFGAPFSGASFLDLLWLPGGFGFGPPLASGASVLDLLWFWTCSGFRGLVFEPLLASRCLFLGPQIRAWTFAPYHFRIPLYMCQVIKPSPICSPSFRFPLRPPKFWLNMLHGQTELDVLKRLDFIVNPLRRHLTPEATALVHCQALSSFYFLLYIWPWYSRCMISYAVLEKGQERLMTCGNFERFKLAHARHVKLDDLNDIFSHSCIHLEW